MAPQQSGGQHTHRTATRLGNLGERLEHVRQRQRRRPEHGPLVAPARLALSSSLMRRERARTKGTGGGGWHLRHGAQVADGVIVGLDMGGRTARGRGDRLDQQRLANAQL
jgi:hypothetical protein